MAKFEKGNAGKSKGAANILTAKQRNFCKQYVIDFNGTQAAVRAGYSKKTAKEQATRLLTNVYAREYISELTSKQDERTQITKDQLVAELAKIAFFDIRKIYTVDGGLKNVNEFGDDEAGAIAGIDTHDTIEPDSGMILGTTKRVKLLNKISAIERISKMLGYDAPEKQILEQTGQVAIFQLPENGR